MNIFPIKYFTIKTKKKKNFEKDTACKKQKRNEIM